MYFNARKYVKAMSRIATKNSVAFGLRSYALECHGSVVSKDGTFFKNGRLYITCSEWRSKTKPKPITDKELERWGINES